MGVVRRDVEKEKYAEEERTGREGEEREERTGREGEEGGEGWERRGREERTGREGDKVGRRERGIQDVLRGPRNSKIGPSCKHNTHAPLPFLSRLAA